MNAYLYLVVILVFVAWALAVIIPGSILRIEPSEPWICVYAYEKTWDDGMLGAISLKIFRAWGEVEIVFVDFGFNGTLDEVRIPHKQLKEIDPDSPDWNIWLERYEKVREWATTGKKPEL